MVSLESGMLFICREKCPGEAPLVQEEFWRKLAEAGDKFQQGHNSGNQIVPSSLLSPSHHSIGQSSHSGCRAGRCSLSK
jgi:hypothetical protein